MNRGIKWRMVYLTRLMAAAALLVLVGDAKGQVAKEDPIDKDTLLNAVRKGLPTDELIGYVQRRGVDFLLSPAIRRTFTSAGAHERLLSTIDATSRLQLCPQCKEVSQKCPEPKECPVPSPCPQCPSPPTGEIREGDPVSKNDTLLLFDAGVQESRIRQILAKRGISYAVTSEVIKELKAAGASDSLVVYVATVDVKVPEQKPAMLSGPLDVIWGTQAAKATKKALPAYPSEAARMGAGGRVILTLLIGPDGRVKSVTPREGHQMLRQVAADAARNWEFQPTLVNGQAVEVKTDMVFDFNRR